MVKLFGRLASLRTDFIVRVQPSFKKDGELLREFLQLDTRVNILCENKTRKALSLPIVCCSEFASL